MREIKKIPKVLVACEESQAVTIEFRKLGIQAYSCDIIDCSGGHPEWHIKQDVLPLLNGNCEFKTVDGTIHNVKGKWDMIIAFPPCTYLSNAGARFLYPKGILNEERYKKGIEGKMFFMKFYNAACDRIAIENPVSSKIYNMPTHTQEVEPFMFGHPVKKKTRFWLKGISNLQPTNITDCKQSTKIAGNWFNKGGKDRQRNRAKTFPGIAKAMAEQWGGEIKKGLSYDGSLRLVVDTWQNPCGHIDKYADVRRGLKNEQNQYNEI